MLLLVTWNWNTLLFTPAVELIFHSSYVDIFVKPLAIGRICSIYNINKIKNVGSKG